MEPSTETTPPIRATTTTSWTPINGSLDAAVTVESSLSPETESDSVVRKPLLLRRPDLTESPCEITVHFTQQHEICQIYVKSTARVYEVYYSTKSNMSNEYLCTVRCGMAVKVETPEVFKDYEVLQAADVEGSDKLSHDADDRCLSATESRTSSGSSTVDDGWVEVKNSSSSWTQNGDGSPPNHSCLEICSQDFFEATAEISDADPCVSLTVRLLSLQNRESVHIDEIYIFANPIESVDDGPPSSSGNSSGNALMSLLVPTLLQLSRSQTSNIQDVHCLPNAPERMTWDGSAQLNGSAVGLGIVQQDNVPKGRDEPKVILEKEKDDLIVDATRVVESKQKKDWENNPDGSCGTNSISRSHLEKTLDELFSRVSKIEDLCLRFEKNMLTPLMSMEARLERVEQRLECFMKDSCSAVPASCVRIAAPDFSCSGSELSSSYTDGSNGASALPDSSENHDSPKEESSTQHHGMDISVNATSLLPTLVVTAPDFFSVDDDEEKDAIDATQEPQQANLRKPLTIDDALASALAGFLLSTSTSTSVSAQVREVEPVNLLANDAEGSGDRRIAPDDFSREPSDVAIQQNVSNIIASMKSLVLTSDMESDEIDDLSPVTTVVPDNCEETEDIVYGGDTNLREELSCSAIESELEKSPKAVDDALSTGDEVEAGESEDKKSQNLVSEYSDILSNIVSNAASEAAFDMSIAASSQEVRKETDLWSTLPRSPSCSHVDFDAPLLDVEFLRQDHTVSLDALLYQLQEPDLSFACVEKNDVEETGVASLLADVEDHESAAPFSLDPRLLNFDYYGSGDTPLYMSGELGNSVVRDDQVAVLSLI